MHNINGKACRICKADACLIRPDDTHNLTSLKRGADYWHLNFLIKTNYIKALLALFGDGLYTDLLSNPEPLDFKITEFMLDDVVSKCLQIQTLETRDIEWNVCQCKLLVGNLLNVFLSQYFPAGKNYPEWLDGFLKYLNNVASFADDAETLAKKTPYVYSHLSRLFKHFTGVTLNQYINSVKINYAKELLLYSDRTILEIAGNLCFDSPSHLNHIFKQQTGLTPSEFKKHNLSHE
jgi:AraC family cel operon transcriptional repressor